MMTKQQHAGGFKILLFLMLSAMVHGAYADGYRNPPPTAEGIGKSDANKVFVDDASAISYNPANLALQDRASVVADVTFARQETTFESATTGRSADSDGDWNTLPNLFFSMPVGDSGFAWGLGITTPFGQGISYDENDLVNFGAFTNGLSPAIHDAQISLVNFNPTVAFKLGEHVAIGVGADIFYSKLEFRQYYPWGELGIPAFIYDEGNAEAEVDADGYGFGGNLALTWNVTERQRMAFTYRSEVEVRYEGDFEIHTVGPPVPPPVGDFSPAFDTTESDFELDIKYPTIIGVGYGIALTDAIHVEASLEWLEWSVNKTLSADLGANGPMDVPQEWDDTFTVAAGGDWRVSDHWVLRAGYAFIETPIPDETSAPSLPDADRHVLSIGLGYTIGGHSLDLAYAYSIYDDRKVDNNQHPAFNGDYDIDSDLLGLTYSYSF
jgi:long-chain fatty acid transport protein